MPRIRTIKPAAFRDAELYDLEHQTGLPIRWAFAGLWTVADRSGRFKWEPRELKPDILPHDDVDFSRVLDALGTRAFVVRYACDGVTYGWIPGFQRHQIVNNREEASKLPPHPQDPDQTTTWTRAPRVTDACPTPLSSAQAEQEQEQEQEQEGNRKGTGTGTVHAPAALAVVDGFAEFWQSYPKKQGKGAALKAWKAIRPSAELRATIAAAIEAQRTCRQWLKDGGQYIPNPATWLNQQRWGDEPDPDGPVLGGVTAHNMAVGEAWLKGHTS